MSDYTYEELKSKPVALLREIAAELEHEAVHGYTIMHKEPLLHAVCTALGLEEHAHHDIVGIDKSEVKRQIRELKVERNGALQAHDSRELKRIRRQIPRPQAQDQEGYRLISGHPESSDTVGVPSLETRRWRHGQGVAGPGHTPGPQGGDQGACRRTT